ncbi:hypothetical protein [Streptomyces sediminimaris]|uniref:hypothetical protein n=1 Tax=Streptomyces sediminimaris TaxID=3383721 RepID=UPI00399BF0DB
MSNALVTTAWRALLEATTAVGRDINPRLAAVPRLARREIMGMAVSAVGLPGSRQRAQNRAGNVRIGCRHVSIQGRRVQTFSA